MRSILFISFALFGGTLLVVNGAPSLKTVQKVHAAAKSSRCTVLWAGCTPSSDTCCAGSTCIKDQPSWALGICKPGGGGGGSQCTALWIGCRTESPNCCPGSTCIKDQPSWAEGICKPGGGGGMVNPTSPPVVGPVTPGALITKNEFVQAVTIHGYPTPSDEQYRNLVNRAASAGQITTKRELAMFLTNILHESDGLRAKEEYSPPQGAYQHPALDRPGKSYHGRGYMQLTWSYNYKAASEALYRDLRLLDNPEQVATNDVIAWETAFWFWSANVHNQPGISQGHFGVSIRAINGGQECGQWPPNQTAARKRFSMYQKVFSVFQLQGQPIETGCYN